MSKLLIVQACTVSALMFSGVALADTKPYGTGTDKAPRTTQDEPRASMRGDMGSEATLTLSESPSVYRALVDNPKGKVPASVRNAAKCIAVFPKITNAAIAIGGSHGDGVAFCKTGANNWGNPLFLNMNAASVGLQAGVRQTDMVIFLTASDAKQRLENGRITLGGELSAVAGTYSADLVTTNTGAVVYSSTEGLFAGAALDGVNLGVDRDEQRRFYGRETKPFEGQIPTQQQPYVDRIRQLLPA